ncbi:hypothetical protein HDV03_002718 [Kappamyces sp. JEL0829]|nr:hypothetical protein HDV03_002718 [Kappamyces sp. JEL0829]
MASGSILDELDLVHETLLKDLAMIGNEEFKVTSYTLNDFKNNFHSKCFVCGNCGMSMEGKAFYHHDGKYLDKDCYHKVILGLCDACQGSFSDPTVIKASGKQYHPACFRCSDCKDALTSSYIEKEGKFLCKGCYEKQFLPPCGACGNPISPEPGTNKLMAIEWKEKKFHVACFACKLCGQPFSDLKAVLHKEDLLCKPCWEKIS